MVDWYTLYEARSVSVFGVHVRIAEDVAGCTQRKGDVNSSRNSATRNCDSGAVRAHRGCTRVHTHGQVAVIGCGGWIHSQPTGVFADGPRHVRGDCQRLIGRIGGPLSGRESQAGGAYRQRGCRRAKRQGDGDRPGNTAARDRDGSAVGTDSGRCCIDTDGHGAVVGSGCRTDREPADGFAHTPGPVRRNRQGLISRIGRSLSGREK